MESLPVLLPKSHGYLWADRVCDQRRHPPGHRINRPRDRKRHDRNGSQNALNDDDRKLIAQNVRGIEKRIVSARLKHAEQWYATPMTQSGTKVGGQSRKIPENI